MSWMRFMIILSTLLALTTGCAAAPTAVPSATDAQPTGEPFYAPDFQLNTLDNRSITLSEQRGQWVIVNFWATWCAPCVAEMPALSIAQAERAATHQLLGINVRESRETVAAFAQEHGIHFPILINPDDAVLLNYNVIGLPQTVVIDPEGEVVWRQFGPIDVDRFGALLDSLIGT